MVYYENQQAWNNCDILQHLTTYKYRDQLKGNNKREKICMTSKPQTWTGQRKKIHKDIHVTGEIFHRYKSCSSMDFIKFRSGTAVHQLPLLKVSVPGPYFFLCPSRWTVLICTGELSLPSSDCFPTLCKYNCHLLVVLHPVRFFHPTCIFLTALLSSPSSVRKGEKKVGGKKSAKKYHI